MPKKPASQPRSWRTGDTRRLVRAIEQAGGPDVSIELTGSGHLKVTRPGRQPVILPSDMSTPRNLANARALLARNLDIQVPRTGGAAPARTRTRRVMPQRWHGTVSRCDPDELYVFITDDDGGSWFASRTRGMSAATAAAIACGAGVSFTGSVIPEHGRRYPEARDVQLAVRREATA